MMAKRFLVTIVFLLFVGAFVSVRPVFSQLISFDSVLIAAQNNSFDLKISQAGVDASQAAIGEVRADYYPHLSVRFGNEYVHAFEEDGDVVSVGDAIIANDASGYKHSLIAGLSYNLFDFGVRKLTVDNAQKQTQIARLQKQQAFWDLRKEVLSRYSDALKIQKEIVVSRVILERQNQIFQLSKELRLAGTVGREKVGTAALEVAESLSRLDDLQVRYQDRLNSLTFFTRQEYSSTQTRLADLAHSDEIDSVVDLSASPAVLALQQQIEQKKNELSMVKRSQLPKLTLYGSYRMFGSEDDSFAHSLSNLSSRDASVTVYLEWPIFDGFASRSKKRRLKHEIDGLRYQKQKKLAEIEQEFSGIVNSYQTHVAGQKHRREQLAQITLEGDDAQLLAEQQITDQISFHKRMIALARQRLAVELGQVDYATATAALAVGFYQGTTR
jgi:outer membrane protein TolC